MTNEPVLVDTSYWIEYFNRPGTERAVAVENFIRKDRAALTGGILAELLQGTRTEEEFSELQTALSAAVWVETTRSVCTRAGRLGFELRRGGVTVPTADCLIAAAAESVESRILTLDGHFEELARVSSLVLLPESEDPGRS